MTTRSIATDTSNGALVSRRTLLAGSGALAATLLLSAAVTQAATDAVDPTDLHTAGLLPDLVLGHPDAPVTVVEYTSLTCGFCAKFHVEALPEFTASHLDTGRARLVIREFPLDPRALAGFMLARSLGSDRALAMIDLLFRRQAEWSRVQNASTALLAIAQHAGMTRESFTASLSDRMLQAAIVDGKNRGQSDFGVSKTPTFFIEGDRHVGTLSAAELGAVVDART